MLRSKRFWSSSWFGTNASTARLSADAQSGTTLKHGVGAGNVESWFVRSGVKHGVKG